jgi:hypothetical protein
MKKEWFLSIFYGFMVLWFYGFMVLWFYGFMVLWFYGFMVLWFYGFMVVYVDVQIVIFDFTIIQYQGKSYTNLMDSFFAIRVLYNSTCG